MKYYYIHNNGGRPFMITIDDNKLDIYKHNDDLNFDKILKFKIKECDKDIQYDEKPFNYGEKIFTVKSYEKVFIGKDYYDFKNNKVSLKHDQKCFIGNSILVKLSKYKYIYIGERIYSFTTKDEIIKYVSPVGNSDVPYPYAIGTENTYLMIEDVVIPNNLLKKYHSVKNNYAMDNNDPYHIYYKLFMEKNEHNISNSEKNKIKKLIHKTIANAFYY